MLARWRLVLQSFAQFTVIENVVDEVDQLLSFGLEFPLRRISVHCPASWASQKKAMAGGETIAFRVPPSRRSFKFSVSSSPNLPSNNGRERRIGAGVSRRH